jgi:hypothetical protein
MNEPMSEPLTHSEAPRSVPQGGPEDSPRAAKASHRQHSYLWSLAVLMLLSTLAGFFAGRFEDPLTKWLKVHSVAAADSRHTAALVSTPEPSMKDSDIEEISRLAPQQQAERLLELAVQQPEFSLGLIHRNLTSWRGHLEDTDHLFHLVLAALNSNDPRVRVAAVEIDLAANNLIKSPESIGKLLKEIQSGSDDRYLALWRLGALGNRGVEPATVFATLQRYARDRNQEVRFWAVEGLAMLGSGESIEALLDILAHDSTTQIRERAAHGLSQSGLLTGEQRLTAVPQLLNLLDDDSLDAATQNLVSSTLQAITGESFGKNAGAWREWWAQHDSPGKSHHLPKNLINA